MRLAFPALIAGAVLALGSLPAAAQQPGTSFCEGQLTLVRTYTAPSAFRGPAVPLNDFHVVLRNQGPRMLVVVWSGGRHMGAQTLDQAATLDFVLATLPASMNPPGDLRFTCMRQ